MMTRKLPFVRFSATFPLRITIFSLFLSIFATADAALTINVRDRAGNPISSARVQIFPGTLHPDSDTEPIPPPTPRIDGLIGFVTDNRGRVAVDLPTGQYSVVAFSDDSHFLIVRETNAPGETTLSLAETLPVTIEGVGERFNRSAPLVGARVSFRPNQRVLGFVGLLNNDGALQAYISPGHYHVVITGSIALHYVVLEDQIITPPQTTIRFDGAVQPTAQLQLDLPPTTGIALVEVLGTNISHEFVDIVESSIGYDAAYTEAATLVIGPNANPMRLTTGLTYQLNLSYVVDLEEVFYAYYAYEIRVNALPVDAPRSYIIGNSGSQPFTLKITNNRQTTDHGSMSQELTDHSSGIFGDKSEYQPGDFVIIRYEIIDTRGNQLYRFFNFSSARLLFPFVTVRDPNGVIIASNPITRELPEVFFQFKFRLPPSAQPGVYTTNVSLDTKMYGRLADRFNFRVVPKTDRTPPRIANVKAPKTAQANTLIKLSARVQDESGVNKLTLNISASDLLEDGPGSRSELTLIPIPLPNNRYEWDLPVGTILPSPSVKGGESTILRWQIIGIDAFGNQSTRSGEIEILDTMRPTIEHTPVATAEIGLELPMTAIVSDNVNVAEIIVSYQNAQMTTFAQQPMDESVHWQPPKSSRDSRFTLRVPASVLMGNELRYFLRATDSAGNGRRLPAKGAFTVKLRDTTSPIIYHTPVTTSTVEPIEIGAVVIDNDAVDTVALNYHQIGEPAIKRIPMQRVEGPLFTSGVADTYTATLPSLRPLTDSTGVAYFLDAQDRSGNRARLPTGEESYQIQLESYPAIVRLELFPESSPANPLTVPVGSMQSFQLRVIDADGHIVPSLAIWSVTSGIGEIDQDGQFYAEIRADRIGQVIATIPALDTVTKNSPSAPDARSGLRSMAVTAWVQLTPAPAEHLLIEADGQSRGAFPGRLALVHPPQGNIFPVLHIPAGTPQAFQTHVLDAYGNARAHTVRWQVEGGIGEMVKDTFHAQTVGRGQLIATAGRLSRAWDIEVTFGTLAELVIHPRTLNLRAGERQQLSATGVDTSGNRVPISPIWSVRGGVGTVRDAIFFADNTGEGAIIATLGDWTATAQVRVTPGVLTWITTDPFITYLPVSTNKFTYTHQFIASGWDAARNPVPIRNLRWTVDAAAGRIDTTGLIHSINQANAQALGNIVINGTVMAMGESETGKRASPGRGVVVIQNAPSGPIQRLEVTLKGFDQFLNRFTLAVGESQKLEAVGVAENNQRVSVSPHWSVIGGVGVIQPDGLFIATQPGTGTAIATDRGRTARMPIEVTQGVLDSLMIYPPVLTLFVGESFPLSVSGTDAYGNPISMAGNKPIWSVTSPQSNQDNNLSPQTAATIDTNGLLTAVYPGASEIEVRIGNIAAQAQLFVYPRIPESTNQLSQSGHRGVAVHGSRFTPFIEVYPNPLQIEPGRTQQFRAYSREASGNRVELANAVWSVTNGLGSIDTRGLFNAQNIGEGHIIATFEGRIGKAYLAVEDTEARQPLRDLIIIPQSPVTLTVGDTQLFYTLGVFEPLRSNTEGLGPPPKQVQPLLAAWNVSGGIGVIDAMGRFTAVTPGQGEVRGTVNGVSTACPVTVRPFSSPFVGFPATRSGEESEGSASLPHFGRKVGDFIAFHVSPESAHVRAGNSLRFTSIGIDAAGNRSHVLPSWQLIADTDIGRMQANGRFVANRVGVGRIVAQLAGSVLPVQQIMIEVLPNRAAFAHLDPSGVVVNGTSTSGVALELIAFDRRGNRTEIPPEQVRWKVVGGVGSILSDNTQAIFNPIPNSSIDRVGEVIAHLPNANLIGRARIFRYAMSEEIVQAWIEPNEINLSPGEQYPLNWITQDTDGRLVESTPAWEVIDARHGSLSGASLLTIDSNAPVGETLRVIGTVVAAGREIRAEGRVRIIAPPLDRIELENLTGKSTLMTGESIHFRAHGFDRRGNPIALSPKWAVNPALGTVEPNAANSSEATLIATSAGVGSVWVNQGDIFAAAAFTVIPASADDLQISIAPLSDRDTTHDFSDASIGAGTVVSLIAHRGKEVVQPTWTVNPSELGSASADGVLIARQAGKGTITAALDGTSTQISIQVTPGALAMLRLKPQIVSIRSKAEPQTFSLEGFDLYSNLLSPSDYAPPRWSVTGGIGTINAAGVFTPAQIALDTAVTGTVVAASEGIYGSASITVVSGVGELAALSLLPEFTRVAANGLIQIQILGRAEDGNLLPSLDTPISLYLMPNIGSVEGTGARWLYRAPTHLPIESERVVSLRAETAAAVPIVSPAVQLTLFPGELAKLQIEPEQVTIRAGDVQAFRLTGTDAFGNVIKSIPEPPVWNLSQPRGALADTTPEGVVYTAETVGTTLLTTRSGNITVSAPIQVIPGELVSLTLSPKTAAVIAGGEVEFRLNGIDAHGNRVDDLEATWRVIGFANAMSISLSPSTPNRRVWKPTYVGQGHIEARWTDAVTGKTLTARAPLQVIPGKLASLEMQLGGEDGLLQRPYVLISGTLYPLKAMGRDAFDNAINVDVTWQVDGNLGQIVLPHQAPMLSVRSDPDSGEGLPLLEAIFVGEGRLSTNAGEVSTVEKITIRPTVVPIGRAGGQIKSPAGIALNIPARAFTAKRNVEISIIKSPGTTLPAQREDSLGKEIYTRSPQIARVVEIRPHKAILKHPAQLTFSYARPIVNEFDSTKLSLYFWDDFQEKWIPISSRVDRDAKTVSASINHFAPYTLMESDQVIPPSDSLRIDAIRLNPPVFYAPETNRLTIEYLLNAPDSNEANVTIEIFDFHDQPVVTILKDAPRRIGRNAEQWDGRTESTEIVRNGRYVLLITAEAGGETVSEIELLVVFK